ncbi:TonB-dependent receptor [Arenimonas sp. GDDSR-1]|uniref:TonB-dependent receptor n=1 Tax=Arenimonas sp. GDDSR-1 TaxID=2950125 RepID=UPI0026058143|nr:TonB-dependent receptor [Arenimonas sp. GDDSR-1]
MSTHTSYRKQALALAISAAVFAPVAAAQDAAVLDKVQVTADRRVENIQDVPVSVSTVSGENLDALASGGADIRFLSGRTPGLNIESSFGRAFPRFYIRGYGNTDFRLNTSQPVSLVYDDVVQENPILKGFPLFDLEQVEVLRGPQGTLFGRNSPAGVVKFNSVKPGEDTTGYAKFSAASYGGVNLEGAVGGGFGEGWSGRVSGLYQHRDDYVDNTYTGEKNAYEGYDEFALRGQLRFESEGFEALLGAHYRNLDGTARLFRANMIQSGTNKPVSGFDRDEIAIDGVNEQELTQFGANARLRWDFDGISVHSITGFETVETYSRGDIDGGYGASFLPVSGPGFIPFASESADGIPEHSQWTQEFRIESNTDAALNWQAGLFYFNEDYKVESFSYDSLAGGAADGYQRIRQTNDSWAAFGAINWDISDSFELRAGVRYTVDNKELTVEDYWNTGFVPCVLLGKCTLSQLAAQEPDGDLSASPEDKKFSWDISGTWKLNEDVNLYARVATGYRGSSIQSAGAFNAKSVAAPETSTSFEAGIKADFWDNRARLNANVFYYEVKDQQLTAVGGSGNANILLNADKSTGQGFELDFQAYLTDSLLVTLGTGYNDTEIKDKNLAVSVCAQCTVTDPLDINGKALINGNALPQAPKWTHNLTARWGMPVGDGGEFYVHTDWVYRSKVNFFLYESVEFTGASYVEGGLRIGYNWNQGAYDLALYGRNITDELAILSGIDFNNLTGMINEPRTVGVEFKAGF